MQTTMVEFAANGGSAPGYLARPDGDGSFRGVVVVQEWWGLDAHIKSVVERFAQAGYVALAPDLYRGQIANEPDDARRLVMELEIPQAMKDIQGAVNYLIAQPFVQPKNIGVIGFCFGGALAGMMSYQGQGVGAVAVFYGGRFKLDDDTAKQVKVPMLGIYGELDGGIPLEMVRNNETLLKQHSKPAEFHVYPGAQHAFFNDSRAHTYHAEHSADAWQKTLDWFGKHLREG
jgi:carboxymethylenebutenolidase